MELGNHIRKQKQIYKFVFLYLLTMIFLTATAQASMENHTLDFNGKKRTYKLYVPDDAKNQQNIPVILGLHPFTASSKFMKDKAKLHLTGPGKDFIVIYPDGYRRSWNSSETCCGPANNKKIDDIGFIKAIIKDLKKTYLIQDQLYIAGFSNGAMMAYHLMCHEPQMVAAIAAYAATRHMNNCKYTSEGISVLHMHGEVDNIAPSQGKRASETRNGREILSAKAMASSAAKINQCDNTTESYNAWNQIIGTSCTQWSNGCNNNAKVRLCEIPGLGHTWPGEDAGFIGKKLYGPARTDLNGSQAVIDFFVEVKNKYQ